MQLRKDIDQQLIDLGFAKYENIWNDNSTEFLKGLFVKDLGGGRRGQSYYLFIDEEFKLQLYASEPDGDSGFLQIDIKIIELLNYIKDNLTEK